MIFCTYQGQCIQTVSTRFIIIGIISSTIYYLKWRHLVNLTARSTVHICKVKTSTSSSRTRRPNTPDLNPVDDAVQEMV